MKRTLMIFGMAGAFFLASCGNDNNDEFGYNEPETTENRYDTDDPMFQDDYAYSEEIDGTTINESDNTVTGVGTTDGIASNNRMSGNTYVCTDSTLVSDIGY